MVECSDASELLRDIERFAGRAAVDRFLEIAGGTRIYFPKYRVRDARSRIVEALGGLESANAIIDEIGRDYGGMNVSIPLYRSSMTAKRSEGIKGALLKGEESVMQIATRFRVTERTIHYWKNWLQDAGLLPMPIHRKATAATPQARENVRLDLLTHSQPDTRTNRDIARLHNVTERYVSSIRFRLSISGRIPRYIRARRHG